MKLTEESHSIRFVETEGSPVVVGNRDKLARIQEAMYDLGLAVDGFIAKEGEQSSNAFASLARHCSVFLRKMVIGDRDKASTRLLDEETCQNAELRFGRLRRIPKIAEH